MLCVVIIDDEERALNCADLIEDELDDIFSKRVDRVVHSEDLTDLSNTTNDPVAFLIPALIFNEIVSHVDEGHSQDIIITCRLEGGVVLTFTNTLSEICVVLQRKHE